MDPLPAIFCSASRAKDMPHASSEFRSHTRSQRPVPRRLLVTFWGRHHFGVAQPDRPFDHGLFHHNRFSGRKIAALPAFSVIGHNLNDHARNPDGFPNQLFHRVPSTGLLDLTPRSPGAQLVPGSRGMNATANRPNTMPDPQPPFNIVNATLSATADTATDFPSRSNSSRDRPSETSTQPLRLSGRL